MTVVASVQFGDIPAGSTSLLKEWLEKRPRRISFRNTGNKCGRNAGLAISRKRKRILKATQTKITQPRADEITRIAWLQSPEIELALPAR